MAVSFGKKIKTFLKLFFIEPKILSSLLSLSVFGYLLDNGWFNSFKMKQPLNEKSEPIPWFTYPFLDFIKGRLKDNFIIFEFGSGNSTKYFAKRVGRVKSVEHSINWYKKLKDEIPQNVELIYSESQKPEYYVETIKDKSFKYDIIIIDGISRNECCKISTEFLSETGVIILDDSERLEYKEGIDYIIQKDFKRLDFWGISPGYLYKKNTTVFYKDKNCLNI